MYSQTPHLVYIVAQALWLLSYPATLLLFVSGSDRGNGFEVTGGD